MKKFLLALAIFVAVCPISAHAGAGSFLFGLMLGSSGNQAQSTVSIGETIYLLPRLSERVADPLAVKFVRSQQGNSCFQGKLSMRDEFAAVVEDSNKYSILEVKIVLTSNCSPQFFFFYVENEKVTPLESLAPQ